MAFLRPRARILLPAMLALASACSDDASDDAADSAAATSAGSASTSPETADATAGAGACGDMCGSNDVCVVPCPCPLPGSCFQRPEIGDCGNGTLDVGGSVCCADAPDPAACLMLEWCLHGPCTADPAYCASENDVTCTDDECEVEDGCSGQRDGDLLTCQVCE